MNDETSEKTEKLKSLKAEEKISFKPFGFSALKPLFLPALALALPLAAAAAPANSARLAAEMTAVPAGDLAAATENFLGEKRVAWRGERVLVRVKTTLPARAKLSAELVSAAGARVPARAEYVRSTLGQGGVPVADVVEPAGTPFRIPAGEAFVLVSADVPADAAPGAYALNFSVNGRARKAADVEVLPLALPPPRAWKIHLDLWQHPEAVARWTGAKLWSREHFAAMRPMMRRLADAGQKVITCSIIEEPWDHQTRDDWSSMVKWRRTRAGTWKFDYAAFDAYVSFMREILGEDAQISCYTMVSWSLKTTYFDEAAGAEKTVSLDPASPDYDATWKAFLTDFRTHVAKKGWLEKTCIALDERPDALVNAARAVVEKYAPELKIVSAVDRPTKMAPFVHDISAAFQHSGGVAELADARRAEGRTTTFYVCTSPAKPNTFPHSSAAEPHWLLLYAAAARFDGFLRWAYNSWVENPFADCRWPQRAWPAGDCFLVYPGDRTTPRFETLRDGVEDFEKIRILEERAALPGADAKLKSAVAELRAFLEGAFTVQAGYGDAHAAQVREARARIDRASALAAKTPERAAGAPAR
ncbi:DUF4091 domain-containing protein [Candidatus Spyradosoma sp. SGI.093]|uniref:DUF4091 domain-containing protein n=1 Tax=Candidatus Spyradosoma sp. SGI.093 TaxID=3420583 RepID=UPI003CFF6B23